MKFCQVGFVDNKSLCRHQKIDHIIHRHLYKWTVPRPSTAPGLGVCEWSPEGLYDKSVSLIPNTDEILKLVNKKMNYSDSTLSTPRPGAVESLDLCPGG